MLNTEHTMRFCISLLFICVNINAISAPVSPEGEANVCTLSLRLSLHDCPTEYLSALVSTSDYAMRSPDDVLDALAPVFRDWHKANSNLLSASLRVSASKDGDVAYAPGCAGLILAEKSADIITLKIIGKEPQELISAMRSLAREIEYTLRNRVLKLKDVLFVKIRRDIESITEELKNMEKDESGFSFDDKHAVDIVQDEMRKIKREMYRSFARLIPPSSADGLSGVYVQVGKAFCED